jgi:predicted nucleotidyltransferase
MKLMMHEDLIIIVSTLRDELTRIFGEQLEAVYLYGSQARGDAQLYSDNDVMIVLRDTFDYFEIVEKVSGVTAHLSPLIMGQ